MAAKETKSGLEVGTFQVSLVLARKSLRGVQVRIWSETFEKAQKKAIMAFEAKSIVKDIRDVI